MKISKIIFGPELFWTIFYVCTVILARANKKSNFTYDSIIENYWVYVPLMSVLIFTLYWVPGIEKNWLLARIWISGIILGHFVLDSAINAYSNQGPGIGTAYIAGMIFLFVCMVAGTIVVKFLR